MTRTTGGTLLLALAMLLPWCKDSRGQINENYTTGGPSGWVNQTGDAGFDNPLDPNRGKNGIIDVNTFQIGRQINGTEAGPFPHPITGGNGPTVLTYDIRAPIAAGEEWSIFQKADRGDLTFAQSQFKDHVLWVEYSSFSNFAASGTETVKLELQFEDALGSGVKLTNNFNTRNNTSIGGTRANQLKPRRALLVSDGQGGVQIDPQTQLPVVRDVLDGNEFNVQLIRENLNYVNFPVDLLPISGGDGVENDDTNPGDADGSQKILNTLFHQRAVIRLEDYARFNFEVEWKSDNPDASGDANWRSLKSTGLGGGAEFANPAETNSLIVTEKLRDITNISLQATRRDVGGFEGLNPPSPFTQIDIHRAAANINTNQTSTAGVPNEQATGNQQVGLGKFVAHVYHRGDLNRSGEVNAADLTGGPLLANFNATQVTDTSILIGSQVRELSWVDGDTLNNGRVTVADALAGVLTGLAGPGPSGPQLLYTSGTGNLRIDTAGQSLSGFALVAAPGEMLLSGSYTNPNPNPATALQTIDGSELGWMNLTTAGSPAGSNLSGLINLGNVLPTGLSAADFEAFFSDAVYNVGGALTKASSFFAVAAPVLAGDYNDDGFVDAADYTVWRDSLGTSDALPGDLIGGTIGSAQYNQWKNNFGASAAIGALQAASVPEPSCIAASLLLLASAWGGAKRRGNKSIGEIA